MVKWIPEVFGSNINEWAWWNNSECMHPIYSECMHPIFIVKEMPIEYFLTIFVIGIIFGWMLGKIIKVRKSKKGVRNR